MQKSASFPSVLAVTLMSTKTHMISDAAFGPMTQSKIASAQQLVGSAQDNSLTLFGRGLCQPSFFIWQGCGQNTHWLTPIKSKLRYEIIESYSETGTHPFTKGRDKRLYHILPVSNDV
nr:hypothetical protein [Enterovibrio nigricans]